MTLSFSGTIFRTKFSNVQKYASPYFMAKQTFNLLAMKSYFEEKRVKKSPIALFATFALSVLFIFLSLAARIALSNSSLFNNAVDFQTIFR
jgi:hypothetical protein